MTEFSGQAGRLTNHQPAPEHDDERSLAYPDDDATSADDLAATAEPTPEEPPNSNGSPRG